MSDAPRPADPTQQPMRDAADRDPAASAHGPGPLGAGAEAVEALHAQQRGAPSGAPTESTHDATTADEARTGRDGARDGQAGSEPLGREREHVGSYGGLAGTPRTSSDQREPQDPTGRASAGGDDALDATGRPAHAALAKESENEKAKEQAQAQASEGSSGDQPINPS